ncbi:MAG: peptide chain release factor-like protein [Elusimicrobia bacterium]|nr:peptide chain release factor-like protein [Elusimicrobiota bacterium]
MGLFSVSPEKEKDLYEKMARLGIRRQDLIEHFVRAQGKGGQNVNKVATAVYLKHVPTGVEVKCQQERSQILNRFLARRILADKIEALILGKKSAAQHKIEKIRRQKRKQSKRAKEKRLQAKHVQAKKKARRSWQPGQE